MTETTVEAASNKVAEQRRKNRRDLDAVNGEAQDPEDSGIDLDNSVSAIDLYNFFYINFLYQFLLIFLHYCPTVYDNIPFT